MRLTCVCVCVRLQYIALAIDARNNVPTSNDIYVSMKTHTHTHGHTHTHTHMRSLPTDTTLAHAVSHVLRLHPHAVVHASQGKGEAQADIVRNPFVRDATIAPTQILMSKNGTQRNSSTP